MKEKLNTIYERTQELIVFLREYIDKPNVIYFLKVLRNLELTTLHYKNEEVSKDMIINLRRIYKSNFFPRDGLGDFYVFSTDREIMNEKNEYLSGLIKELDGLLE